MSTPLYIYLADFTYVNHLNLHTRHVPKNIGYIATYAKKMFEDNINVRLFTEPEELLED